MRSKFDVKTGAGRPGLARENQAVLQVVGVQQVACRHIDLTRDDGREVFLDLVEQSDVVMENNAPGLLRKLRLLREDAGFHAYQMLEAGVRQFREWGNDDHGRHILIAVTRYLAAHFPTQRTLLQTADISRRLMRGGELHREAQAG